MTNMIKRDWLFASLICAVIYRAEYKSSLLARTRHLQHALTDGLFINEYIISLPIISWVTNYARNRECLTFFLYHEISCQTLLWQFVISHIKLYINAETFAPKLRSKLSPMRLKIYHYTSVVNK